MREEWRVSEDVPTGLGTDSLTTVDFLGKGTPVSGASGEYLIPVLLGWTPTVSYTDWCMKLATEIRWPPSKGSTS